MKSDLRNALRKEGGPSKSKLFSATGISALHTVVVQSFACQSLFGKDSGLLHNPTTHNIHC